MLIDELIEKAFCDGYEYAQKEFTSIRQLKKMGKNFKTGNAIDYLRSIGAVTEKEAIRTNPIRSLKRSIPGGLKNTENHIEKLGTNLLNKKGTDFGKKKIRSSMDKHQARLDKIFK